MLGAVVYKLKAMNDGELPKSHGRFAHGAVLRLINDYAPAVAAFEHGNGVMNDFTIAPIKTFKPLCNDVYKMCKDDMAEWRVTALNKTILDILINIQVNSAVRIGNINFSITDILCDQNINPRSGAISVQDFLQAVAQLPAMHTLTLEFLEPTTFRVNDRDYPYPLPELIFGSLAKRWQASTGMELPIEDIKKQAAGILVPINWEGATKRVFLGPKGGVTGFVGKYTFDIHYLSEDMQKTFLLLAEFAVFSGVGRLTGQGLGQLSVAYE